MENRVSPLRSPPRRSLRADVNLQNNQSEGQLGSILSYLESVESDPRASFVPTNAAAHSGDNGSDTTRAHSKRFVWDDWCEGDDNSLVRTGVALAPHSPGSTVSGLSSPGRGAEAPVSQRVRRFDDHSGQGSIHAPVTGKQVEAKKNEVDYVSHGAVPAAAGDNRHQFSPPPVPPAAPSFTRESSPANRNVEFSRGSSYGGTATGSSLSSPAASSSASSSSSTALAFREVQTRVRSMQAEMEGRQDDLRSREREYSRAKSARSAALGRVKKEGSKKLQEQTVAGKEACEKQKAFLRRLDDDVTKLRVKYEELTAQAERVERRRSGEVEGARRESAGLLKREREQWVSSEKGKLSKLASEKGEGLKEEAVRALEPALHELIRFQRQELRTREAQLEDEHRHALESLRSDSRQHGEQGAELQRLLDQELSASMESQRLTWTTELQRLMVACEQSLQEAKHAHTSSAGSERVSHDATWRRVRAEQDAEAEAIRNGGRHAATILASEHALRVTDVEASQRKALLEQKARHAAELVAFQSVALGEVVGAFKRLDALALDRVKKKAREEFSMVETLLRRESDSEVSALSARLSEKRTRTHAELSSKRSALLVLGRDVKAALRRGVGGEEAGGDESKQSEHTVSRLAQRVGELQNSLESSRESAQRIESALELARAQRRAAAAQCVSRGAEKRAQSQEARKVKEESQAKRSAGEAAAAELKANARSKAETAKAEQEAELLRFGAELESERGVVRRKVSSVLQGKERSVAELAEKLSKAQEANDKKSAALASLRQRRFAD